MQRVVIRLWCNVEWCAVLLCGSEWYALLRCGVVDVYV